MVDQFEKPDSHSYSDELTALRQQAEQYAAQFFFLQKFKYGTFKPFFEIDDFSRSIIELYFDEIIFTVFCFHHRWQHRSWVTALSPTYG